MNQPINNDQYTIGSARIYTIGYQQRSANNLVELVSESDVDIIVDVREYPSSRKKGLSKTPLRKKLARYDIGYQHAKFAGNPKRFRDAAGSYEECLKMYESHLEANPGITQAFRALVRDFLENGESVCLMCYERHPLDCHRSILLRHSALEERTVHLGINGADRFTEREELLDA